jgi:transcription antitermination factor NusG
MSMSFVGSSSGGASKGVGVKDADGAVADSGAAREEEEEEEEEAEEEVEMEVEEDVRADCCR